jgi:hypothetical protein
MSNKKTEKKSQWGGARKGSGRPKGSGTKVKICVSVNADNWQTALKSSKDTASGLVDKLIANFVQNPSHLLNNLKK